MAPDVILEVDHIKPVAEGGNNGMLNLITSCRDCNRGKGKIKLDTNQELKKQQEEMLILAEKREQLKMMMEWRNELSNLVQEEVDYICDYWASMFAYGINDVGRSNVVHYLKQFNINEILDAIDIAFTRYYKGSQKSAEIAFNKIGGICYNRRKMREEEDGDL